MNMFCEHRLIHRFEDYVPQRWRDRNDLSALWDKPEPEEMVSGWEIAEEQTSNERNIRREMELFTSEVTQRFKRHIEPLFKESEARLDTSEKRLLTSLSEELDTSFERHLQKMERHLESMIGRVRADLTARMNHQISIIDQSLATIKSYIEVRY